MMRPGYLGNFGKDEDETPSKQFLLKAEQNKLSQRDINRGRADIEQQAEPMPGVIDKPLMKPSTVKNSIAESSGVKAGFVDGKPKAAPVPGLTRKPLQPLKVPGIPPGQLQKNQVQAEIRKMKAEKARQREIKSQELRAKQDAAITIPPGLADERLRMQLEKQKALIEALRQKKRQKLEAQLERWSGRSRVVDAWDKQDEAHRKTHETRLAKYAEEDQKAAEVLMRNLKAVGDDPAKQEKVKAIHAEQQARKRAVRARIEEQWAAQEARRVASREQAQARRDQVYNFVGQFLGWEKRTIPSL